MQRGFTDNLQVWHKAMNLAKGVYLYCRVLPVEERFGLCDQMRRAAVSVTSNIAEGLGGIRIRNFFSSCQLHMVL